MTEGVTFHLERFYTVNPLLYHMEMRLPLFCSTSLKTRVMKGFFPGATRDAYLLETCPLKGGAVGRGGYSFFRRSTRILAKVLQNSG